MGVYFVGDIFGFEEEGKDIRFGENVQEDFQDFFAAAHSIEPVVNDCNFVFHLFNRLLRKYFTLKCRINQIFGMILVFFVNLF